MQRRPATVAGWMIDTLEYAANQERLCDAGVGLLVNTTLLAVETGQALLQDSLRRRRITVPADGIVMVTARLPEDGLYREVLQSLDAAPDTGIRTLRRVGDCQAPGIIATAVYEGHRYARELGVDIDPGDIPFRRERHVIEPGAPALSGAPARARHPVRAWPADRLAGRHVSSPDRHRDSASP